MMENKLQKGWQQKTLGDILKITSGSGLTKSKRNDDGKFLVYGGNGITGKHDKYLFEDEKLIIGRVGVHCGNAHITKSKSWVTDNAFVVSFNEKELDKKFLLNLIGILDLNKYSVSTAQPVISQGTIYPIEIVLPPLETQQAIVSKIEELFSALDKGIEDLKTAQQQLKTYRQSVLKWAFEGKLTNENVKEGELPKGWEIKILRELTLKVEKVKRKEVNEKEELIYLDIGGLDNNFNKIENYKTYEWKDAPSRAQQIVKVNDILFSTVRTYMKNIAIVDKEIFNNQIASSGFTVLRANEQTSFKYIFYNTISDIFLNPLNELQTGSSYPAVRDSDVFNQKISIPNSLEEQHQIVQEIESRLSVADKMEENIAHSLLQAESLRQSILKKAFAGELVEL